MNPFHPKAGKAVLLLMSCVSLASCIDDNYDLSDIDTTTHLAVNDLTVPINFKEIYLDKIIDTNDDPDATIVIKSINGKRYYCISKGGEFDADPKLIDKIHAPAPDHIESSTITASSVAPAQAAPGKAAPAQSYREYNITPYHSTFDYRIGRDGNPKVDPAILSVSEVVIDPSDPLHTTLVFSSRAIAARSSRVELHDLEISIPAGATAHYGTIQSQGNILTIPTLSTTSDNLSITIDLDRLSFVTPDTPNGKTVTDGCFDFSEEIGVESGRFRVYPAAGQTIADLPEQIDFTTNYEMSAFSISMFSGDFNYAVDFEQIAPIELNDLPEFLAGEETDVILAKPALTLDLNSPVARYGLECTSGLTLTARRDESDAPVSEVLDLLTINNLQAQQFHVLAPDRDALTDLDLPSGAIFTPYPGLGHILSGEGIPTVIDIDFSSPARPKPIVTGHASHFPLGQSLDQVRGIYEFTAPLALANGSTIVYTSTEDGWNDDDVDAIAISCLKVKAKATSTVPAAAKIYIRPIDKEGNRIPLTNAATAYATLPANATDYDLHLELLGDIRHLDGVYIEAIVNDFDGSDLSPDSSIKVTGLSATVTGTYTKEL